MLNRQMNDNANATNVVQRMEDAIRVHRYMLKEKLPKEIQHKIDHIALMEKLLQSPNPTPTELQLIIHKVSINRAVYDWNAL